MTRYSEFFFADTSEVVQYDTFVISHPSFSREFAVVRNARDGITATSESGDSIDFQFVPMRVEDLGKATDLDYGLRVTLGDLGEIVPQELDLVHSAASYDQYPTAVYRAYASDTLTAPMLGPFTLKITALSFSREGCVFECRPQTVNRTRTGEPYTVEKFFTLAGFQ